MFVKHEDGQNEENESKAHWKKTQPDSQLKNWRKKEKLPTAVNLILNWGEDIFDCYFAFFYHKESEDRETEWS